MVPSEHGTFTACLKYSSLRARASSEARLFGDFLKAEAFYRRVLSRSERKFGAESAAAAAVRNNLGTLYLNWARYGEAERLFLSALTIWEKTGGPDHPETLSSTNNLAVLYVRQKRERLAEPLCRRVLAMREKLFGPKQPDVARFRKRNSKF